MTIFRIIEVRFFVWSLVVKSPPSPSRKPLNMGLAQKELSDRWGTDIVNFSKIENDVRVVRIDTTQRIVEEGLDGELHFKIKLRQTSK